MKIKLSATYEGKCDVCKKRKIIFTAGDEDTHKAVSICEECSEKFKSKTTSDMIEEYGRKNDSAFESGVRVDKGVAG